MIEQEDLTVNEKEAACDGGRRHMRPVIRRLIYVGAALIVGIASAFAKGITDAGDAIEVFAILTDAMFVPGVIFTGVGILSVLARQGAYDALGYSVRTLFEKFRNFGRETPTFYDYKQEKANNGKKPLYDMLWTGVACLGFAAVCLVIYLYLDGTL